MQLIKRVFDFYVFSNIHVALAAFSLTKITLLFFDILENTLPLFVFFATLLSYNFIRIYRKIEIKSWLYSWIQGNEKLLYVLTFASLLPLIYFGLQLNRNTQITLIPLGVLTLFYVIPFQGRLSLRTLSGFKLFLITSCWAAVTVLLPVINYEISPTSEVIIIFLQRILFVAAITLPFDIRDVAYDTQSLKTVPQVFGILKAKRIGIFLLMVFLGLNFLRDDPSKLLTTEFVVTLISLFFLVRSSEQQDKYYSAFFVEGIPIVWLLLILI